MHHRVIVAVVVAQLLLVGAAPARAQGPQPPQLPASITATSEPAPLPADASIAIRAMEQPAQAPATDPPTTQAVMMCPCGTTVWIWGEPICWPPWPFCGAPAPDAPED